MASHGEYKLTSDNTIVIKVESTKTEILCHKCGEICESHGKGTTIKLRQLPILGRKTYIELTPPRGICRKILPTIIKVKDFE